MNPSYYGLPTRKIGNEKVSLEYLANCGPRIVRLFLPGYEGNFLGELPDTRINTDYGTYWMRGGHRLWHSPEANPRTYIPDDQGIQVIESEKALLLSQPVEILTGIEKSLEIQIIGNQASVILLHHLTNRNVWPIELAPWAITQLPLGGVAILPNPSKIVDEHGLLPNRHLTLWPYTRWTDTRLHLNDDCYLIAAKSNLPPVKIGYYNREGWAAYYQNGAMLVKIFEPKNSSSYPDFGCNVECYCNDEFIELETLGPLVTLHPGQSVTHQEKWEFFTGLNSQPTLNEVRIMLGISVR